MEDLFYSPSSRGFYAPEIHGDRIPVDALPLSRERHAHLLEQQSQGLEIVPGPDGVPVAVQPAVPVAAVMSLARALREPIMVALDRIQMRALSTEDQLRVDVETAKDKLRDLPALVEPMLAEGMPRAQMEDIVQAEYQKLVLATPEYIRAAFKSLAQK